MCCTCDNYFDKWIIDSVGLFVLFFSFKYKKRVMELVCKMHVHATIYKFLVHKSTNRTNYNGDTI